MAAAAAGHVVAVLVGPSYEKTLASVDEALVGMVPACVSLVTHAEALRRGGVDGVLVLEHAPVTPPLLAALRPRVVSNYGVGVDHIDVAACADAGAAAGHTPGILTEATADMAWALLLACARRVVEADRYARGPTCTEYRNMVLLGKSVNAATLGVIGMGRIGEAIARRAVGFGMRVLYYNRSRNAAAEDRVAAQFVTLQQLLEEVRLWRACRARAFGASVMRSWHLCRW